MDQGGMEMSRSLVLFSLLGVVFFVMQPTCGGEEPLTIVALDGVHQYFGEGDTRTVDVSVTFPPADASFSRIVLRYTLSCPEGGCDPWDRLASLFIVEHPGTDGEEPFEIGRFITPYGVGGAFEVDVTELRPLLTGVRTLRSFVSTWVEPGWIVDVRFEFYPGVPDRHPVEVRRLWHGAVLYGDPAHPLSEQLPERVERIPEWAVAGELRVLATGHGQGNTENCAEFCAKEHLLAVDDATNRTVLWRDDCKRTAVKGQRGTWWLSRAGWCPGAAVIPRIWAIDALSPGTDARFRYEVEPYENTCRPDHEPECTDCMSFVTSCDYNGGDHTPPIWQISTLLILFDGA
ncbi:MAG: hypothetical protein D6812_17245 [Deltaproteobacteria bacterium]|nr:MAG: hypothetical protein D6812_17245 [Deltaproteobacteria bacterium]